MNGQNKVLQIVLLIGTVVAVAALQTRSERRLQVAYAAVSVNAPAVFPVAAALFSYSNAQGVLVSQATAAAVEPIRAMSVFVDEDGTQTGVGLVNSSANQAAVTMTLRDASGRELTHAEARRSLVVSIWPVMSPNCLRIVLKISPEV